MPDVQLVCMADDTLDGERGDILAIHDGTIDLSSYSGTVELWVVTIPNLSVAEARTNLQPISYDVREIYRTVSGWQAEKPVLVASILESRSEWKHDIAWKKYSKGTKGMGRSLNNLTTNQIRTLESSTSPVAKKIDVLKLTECVMVRRPENQIPTPLLIT